MYPSLSIDILSFTEGRVKVVDENGITWDKVPSKERTYYCKEGAGSHEDCLVAYLVGDTYLVLASLYWPSAVEEYKKLVKSMALTPVMKEENNNEC